MDTLKGKRAVITGGSEGIGFAIAEAFVKNGADVLLISRDEEKLLKAKGYLSAYNESVAILSSDLSDLIKIPELAKTILTTFGDVDILVNNAGMAVFDVIENVSPSQLDHIIKLNVRAPYILTQQLLPSLLKTKGNIINLSSYFSHRMIPGRYSTAYSLTKGAMDSFTKALACELGPHGIRVNAIAPGSVKTPLFNSAMDKMAGEQRETFSSNIKTIYPLGHIGEPDDIGAAALFLASEGARWITGSILSVDGGLTTN